MSVRITLLVLALDANDTESYCRGQRERERVWVWVRERRERDGVGEREEKEERERERERVRDDYESLMEEKMCWRKRERIFRKETNEARLRGNKMLSSIQKLL